MLSPLGFALGNVFLCPIFMTFKVLITPVDPDNRMLAQTFHHSHANGTITAQYEVGASLHVYSWWDISMIVMIAFFNFIQQIAMTLAYRYEKAGRVAPFLYLQILFCVIADIILFGT